MSLWLCIKENKHGKFEYFISMTIIWIWSVPCWQITCNMKRSRVKALDLVSLSWLKYSLYKYKNTLETFPLCCSLVLVWVQYTSFFIFIAVPFSSFSPSAFPEEVKSVQTTIKLIEPARYQLRCSRPWQRILHWPCRTLAWCYLSKFNSGPAATDPSATASLFMSSSDWNTHSYTRRPDFHAVESAPLWVRHEHEGLAEPYPSASVPSSPHIFCPLCFVCFHICQYFSYIFYLWSQIISCKLVCFDLISQ